MRVIKFSAHIDLGHPMKKLAFQVEFYPLSKKNSSDDYYTMDFGWQRFGK